MMNAKFSQPRCWPCHESGIIKTIPTLLHHRAGQIFFGQKLQTSQVTLGQKMRGHQFLAPSRRFLPRLESSEIGNSSPIILKMANHYLSYTKISQTKCYKQSDTIFQFSFHCSFRCCAPFCSLCCPLRPLLLIGGKLSTANQDPPKEWF